MASPHLPTKPVRYDFFTTVAVTIYETAIANGASKKGAVLVISQASLESGFAQSAIKYGDYNLFGQMTQGNDFKRKTAHGKVKDFSKAGGYEGSMAYYFSHISAHQWTGLALIKKEDFTAQDIDDAFNTGTDYPTDKERHGGKYAYNSDMGADKKNHYGAHLYLQMKTTKTRMVDALVYKIRSNEQEIMAMEAPKPAAPNAPSPQRAESYKPPGYRTDKPDTLGHAAIFPSARTAQTPVGRDDQRARKEALVRENDKLRNIINSIRTVPI